MPTIPTCAKCGRSLARYRAAMEGGTPVHVSCGEATPPASATPRTSERYRAELVQLQLQAQRNYQAARPQTEKFPFTPEARLARALEERKAAKSAYHDALQRAPQEAEHNLRTGSSKPESVTDREAFCWKCFESISTSSDEICERCGWIRCACGACRKGCPGHFPDRHP